MAGIRSSVRLLDLSRIKGSVSAMSSIMSMSMNVGKERSGPMGQRLQPSNVRLTALAVQRVIQLQ
jgi:hypothetical protein